MVIYRVMLCATFYCHLSHIRGLLYYAINYAEAKPQYYREFCLEETISMQVM